MKFIVWLPKAAHRAALVAGLLAGTFLALGATASTDSRLPSNSPLPQAEPPVGDSLTYTNALMGFSITAPPEWTTGETGRRVPVVDVRPPGFSSFVSIQVSIHRHVGSDDVREWTDWQVSRYGQHFIDILEESYVELGPGTSGFRMVFEWNSGIGIKEQWTGVLHGEQSFVIRTFGIPSDFDGLREITDEVVSTFAVLEPDPTQSSPDDIFVLLGDEPVTLDPALHSGPIDGPVSAIFGGLVTLDENLNVVPDIAESWLITDGATVYTFKIRFDAFFHSGDWVTAPDVKYSWERATEPATGSPTASTYLGDIVGVREKLAGKADDISGVEVLDLFTLRVTITSPRQSFLQKLTHPVSSVVDRNNVEAGDLADQPNGTGPYKLVTWGRGQGLILGRNRFYHRERSKMLGVVYRFGDDDPFPLYKSKQIDVMPVPLTHVDQSRDPRSSLNLDLLSGPTFCTHYLAFDTNTKPFDNLAVRRAFVQAVDIGKLVALTMKGTVDRASTIVPPGILGHDDELTPILFDPEAAQSLLAESLDGVNGSPTVLSAVDPTMNWMWRQNLGVNVQAVAGPSFQATPVWTDTWCPDYLDPENFLEILFHTDGLHNRFGYSNPKVDELLEQAAIDSDKHRRMEAYKAVERIIRDDLVVVPLWHPRRYELVHQHVAGYELPRTGAPFFQGIYFEQ